MHHEVLQMFKSWLTSRKMSDAAFVDQAAKWTRDLAQMRSRGPGDLENSMRSIEREYGVDYWAQWSLRYRRDRFKDIGIGLFLKIKCAWEAERERQLRRLQHDIEITKKIAGDDHAAVRAAEALVRAEDGEG
jgi:hypothetical protein